MARETTYYCEAPDCKTHVRAMCEPPATGFLVVRERVPSEPVSERDFCSWDCVMRFAATLEPTEVIEFGTPEAPDA